MTFQALLEGTPRLPVCRHFADFYQSTGSQATPEQEIYSLECHLLRLILPYPIFPDRS